MKDNWRVRKRRFNSRPRLPQALIGNRPNLVVAYGEAEPRSRDQLDADRRPICWMAQRLGAADAFCSFIDLNKPLEGTFLGHLDLNKQNFDGAATLAEFADNWRQFVRPDDVIVVYNQGTARLLRNVGCETRNVVLKQVCANIDQRTYGSLAGLMDAKNIVAEAPRFPGRAGHRLADTVALTLHLLTKHGGQ